MEEVQQHHSQLGCVQSGGVVCGAGGVRVHKPQLSGRAWQVNERGKGRPQVGPEHSKEPPSTQD